MDLIVFINRLTLQCKSIQNVDNIFEKVIPTLISTTVVVFIYFLGKSYDIKIRKKEISRNWYLKVIIEPNISKVDLYIDDIFVSVKDSINLLFDNKSKLVLNDYIILKSKEIGKFQKIKRKFELDFILLIQSNYPQIATELTNLLMESEDIITNILDKENIEINEIDLIEKHIKNYKSKFLSILYKPFSNI